VSFFDTDKLLQHLQQCRKWLCVSAELWQMTCNCLSHLPQGNEVDDFITSGPKAGDFETYPSFWENAAAYKKNASAFHLKRHGVLSQTPRRFLLMVNC